MITHVPRPPREAAQSGAADEGPRARDTAENCNPLRATPGVKNHDSTDPSEALVHGLAAEYPNPSLDLDWLAVMSRVAYARAR